MSLTEIFTDSLKYPFSDMTKFCILGVIMAISSLGSLDLWNETLTLILGIIGFIASIIAGGYGVSIVKNAIIRSDWCRTYRPAQRSGWDLPGCRALQAWRNTAR